MEYSLKTLNENSDLKDLQTSKIIERLNLIGFEVDGLIQESTFLSSFEENLKLLIKISLGTTVFSYYDEKIIRHQIKWTHSVGRNNQQKK